MESPSRISGSPVDEREAAEDSEGHKTAWAPEKMNGGAASSSQPPALVFHGSIPVSSSPPGGASPVAPSSRAGTPEEGGLGGRRSSAYAPLPQTPNPRNRRSANAQFTKGAADMASSRKASGKTAGGGGRSRGIVSMRSFGQKTVTEEVDERQTRVAIRESMTKTLANPVRGMTTFLANRGKGKGTPRKTSTPGLRVEEWLVQAQMTRSLTRTDGFGLTRLGELRRNCQRIVESARFNVSVTLVIVLNAVYIGLETDYRDPESSIDGSAAIADEVGGAVGESNYNHPGWYVGELVFTVIFTVELVLRLLAYKSAFFYEAWNNFDFLLVSVAIVNSMLLLAMLIKGADSQEGGTLDVFVAMRVAKLLRLARIFRLLRFFKELWLLVSGVLQSVRTLMWMWTLVLIVVYVFGIFMTRIVGQPHGCALLPKSAGHSLLVECEVDDGIHDRCDSETGRPVCDTMMDQYFGTVAQSMLTLFQMITTEDWALVARRAMGHVPFLWVGIIFFLSITTFALMNVVIAVIVESTLDQALVTKEDIGKRLDSERKKALEKIYEVFRIADVDGNGELTKEEFLHALNDPEVKRAFHEVEIDMHNAESLFDILDYDMSGALDIKEFIDGCMRTRGDAKAKDVLGVQGDLWRTQQWVQEQIASVDKEVSQRFDALERMMHPILEFYAIRLLYQNEEIQSNRDGEEEIRTQGEKSLQSSPGGGIDASSSLSLGRGEGDGTTRENAARAPSEDASITDVTSPKREPPPSPNGCAFLAGDFPL